jgi:hypothetical protein
MAVLDEKQKEGSASVEPGPEITEFYKDYVPPGYVRPIVEELLAFLPRNYLVGLKTVLLTNSVAMPRDQRRQKVFQRGKSHKMIEARGAYYRATRSRQAYVALFVDNIFKNVPPSLLRLTPFRHSTIAEILFHEVGHHIHTAHKPVYDVRENVAEAWERKFRRAYLRKRFWYIVPTARPVKLLLRVILLVGDWISNGRHKLKQTSHAPNSE